MNTVSRLATAISLGLAFATAASAAGPAMNADSPAVEKLKSKLPNALGFEVESARTNTDGTACISYHVSNDTGGVTHEKAVVEGDKVLRSTTGNTRFASAWKEKCAKAQ
jgi:hypothetical protein